MPGQEFNAAIIKKNNGNSKYKLRNTMVKLKLYLENQGCFFSIIA
jgi:hypothetical protein